MWGVAPVKLRRIISNTAKWKWAYTAVPTCPDPGSARHHLFGDFPRPIECA